MCKGCKARHSHHCSYHCKLLSAQVNIDVAVKLVGWAMISHRTVGYQLGAAAATVSKGLRSVSISRTVACTLRKLLRCLIDMDWSKVSNHDPRQPQMYHTALIQLLPVAAECALPVTTVLAHVLCVAAIT